MISLKNKQTYKKRKEWIKTLMSPRLKSTFKRVVSLRFSWMTFNLIMSSRSNIYKPVSFRQILELGRNLHSYLTSPPVFNKNKIKIYCQYFINDTTSVKRLLKYIVLHQKVNRQRRIVLRGVQSPYFSIVKIIHVLSLKVVRCHLYRVLQTRYCGPHRVSTLLPMLSG